ncbi:PKD domain-containing protein [Naasia lichenicola]|nr:PKD domain-containing protein [Naasia lichenicola]
MTVGRRSRALISLLTLSTVAGGLALGGAAPAFADPGGVVISELNYHAGSDLDGDDFVELTNTSSAPIDMSGWSFSAGVTGTFPAGASIAGNGYFVIAKDAAQFQLSHGFAPDAVYGGNLSNGGEAVTIVDAALAVVDTVTYADATPWPATPDGTGPTLELRDLFSDNTLADSWGASLTAGGTPHAVNSIAGTGPAPTISELTATPNRPTPNQAIAVSARLLSGSTATLTYRIAFGADTPLPFLDDAASPGGAGDGVYGATIPGQAAGQLVRYRIDATRGAATFSAPAADDSARYRGVVVTNSAVSTQLPVIEWFMDDAVYNDLLANHREDDVQGAAVWSYNGEVFDNVLMNIRGGASRQAAKVQWKVELPKGYEWDMGGQLPYPIDEFALQNYSNNNADISWATVKAAGNRGPAIIPVRTQKNGTFWSLGRIMETEDGSWRDDQGVDDWAIYKGDGGSLGRTASPAALQANAWLDKKTREDEDYTDVWNLSQNVSASSSAAQQAWIYQNVNIPELVNYMAIQSIIRHQDSGWHNWYVARDTEGTGRWEMWQWDLDLTFGTAATDNKGLFLTPDTTNNFTIAMLNYPEVKEMYYRRLRTLADQFLPAGQYEAQWDAITATTNSDWALDSAKWGSSSASSNRTRFLNGLADRRNAIANNTGAGKLVPTSQSSTAAVVINELQYNPAGTGGEFIELANPSGTAVDVSGWTIDAVGLTIQPGTVIPAGGRVVFVGNDVAFRAAYSGNRFVGGQFSGALDNSGETVELRAGARVVDTVSYSPTDPWPAAADGTGPSLELNSTSSDNSLASSWTATSTTGGTPGLINTASAPANLAPTASFTNGGSGLAATFSGTGSSDADGTIASYSWNFGDSASGTGATTTHSYASAGTYTVTLTVTDNAGAIGTTSRAITVSTTTTPPTGNQLALDSFTRTVSGGLGTAQIGGTWTTSSGATSFGVANGTANISTASGSTRYAYLAGVSSTDTDVTATISVPRPTASSVYAGILSRRVGSSDYRARVVIASTGAVQLQVQATATTLQSVTPAGLTYNTGDRLQLRVQTVGTSPTTLRAKVWKVGTAEPSAWQISRTDTTSGLQTAGSIALYSYLSSSATPANAVIAFDDLSATTSGTVTPPANAAPTAAFTSTPNGLAVGFNGSTSTDSDGTIASYAWNFGDGTTGTGATTSRTYAAAGTYTATLTVTDNGGATNSTSRSITVTSAPPANIPPTAAFTSTSNVLAVSFNGSTSTDSDGTIASYAWNFGDGSTGTGATTSRTYAAAGTYTVTLTVTDNGGATNSTSRTVTVSTVTPPVGTAFAADAFARTTTNSFGTADTGGAWTTSSSTASYSVSGGLGRITTPAGSERNAYLASVSSASTDLTATFGFPRTTTGSTYVGLMGRRVGTANYTARAVVSTTGAVRLQALRTGTTLQEVRVSGLTYAAGDRLQVRVQVFGASPTTVRAKVWKVGMTEPTTWQVSVSDATAGLQSAGGVGIYTYLSSGSAPSSSAITVDDVRGVPAG